MKTFHYIKNFLEDTETVHPFSWKVSSRIDQLLHNKNNYPMTENDEEYSLYIMLIPFYEKKSKEIKLVECDILMNKKDIYFITNYADPLLEEIIHNVDKIKNDFDSTVHSFIINVSSHILDIIDQLEKVITAFSTTTLKEQGYTESSMEEIMRLKLTIGLFKSTLSPFTEVISSLGEVKIYKNHTTKEMRNHQISYLIKQITAESNFLYENISIVADTSNSIQDIKASGIMRTLTIMSSIFIPLSFIAWVFGMNFPATYFYNTDNFYTILIIMVGVGISLYLLFKYKKRF